MYFREQRTTMKKAWEIEGQYRKVQGIGQHIAKHMESLPPARARRLRVSDETKRILDDTPLLVWVGTRMPASFFGYLAAIHRHLPPRRLVAALAVLVVGSMRRGDVPEELLALLTILLDTRESYARDIALDVRPHQKGFPKRNASAWTQLDFFEWDSVPPPKASPKVPRGGVTERLLPEHAGRSEPDDVTDMVRTAMYLRGLGSDKALIENAMMTLRRPGAVVPATQDDRQASFL